MVNSVIFFPHSHTDTPFPTNTHTRAQNTHLPCSCVVASLSPINQAALESIQNIKRLNLFRCLALIAHYTIITHLESHGPWEGETRAIHPHTLLHRATSQTHSKSIGLQLNRWCQWWRWAFMGGVSERAKRNSTRNSRIWGGIQFIASWNETLLLSPFVDYGLLSSGMQA